MTRSRTITWVMRVEVVGSQGDKYTVAQKANGDWGCSCPRWIFHKAPKVHCKHIQAMLAAYASADSYQETDRKFRWEEIEPGMRNVNPAVMAAISKTIMAKPVAYTPKPVYAMVGDEEFTVTRKFREDV